MTPVYFFLPFPNRTELHPIFHQERKSGKAAKCEEKERKMKKRPKLEMIWIMSDTEKCEKKERKKKREMVRHTHVLEKAISRSLRQKLEMVWITPDTEK